MHKAVHTQPGMGPLRNHLRAASMHLLRVKMVLILQVSCSMRPATCMTERHHVDVSPENWTAAVERAKSGSTVAFAPGMYYGCNVSLPANVTLIAALASDAALRAGAHANSGVTVDCRASERHFSVGKGVTNVRIEGLTLVNGRASNTGSGQGGGCVLIEDDASISLLNVSLRNCSASGSTGKGGAIFVGLRSTLWMRDVTVHGGLASSHGGGLYLWNASLVCTRCTIDRNVAFHGGGIFSINGSLELNNGSSIMNNIARHRGGGILLESSTMILSASHIQDNLCSNYGGGLDASRSTITLEQDASVRGNSVAGKASLRHDVDGLDTASGGGIAMFGSQLSLVHSSVSDNKADGMGAGVLAAMGAGVNATSLVRLGFGTSIERNVALDSGGGLAITGGSTFVVCGGTGGLGISISSNDARHGSGGGLLASSSVVRLGAGDLMLQNNSAGMNGGAMALLLSSQLHRGGRGQREGRKGSVGGDEEGMGSCIVGPHSVTRLTVRFNSVLGNGGGLAISGGSTLAMAGTEVEVVRNVATNGGGIFVKATGSEPRTVVADTASCNFLAATSFSILQLHDNMAVGGDGGGLCSYQIVNLLAGGRTNVTGNTARRHGGAMALHDNDLLVHAGHRLLASGNVASTHGGALALLSGAKLDFLVDEVCQTNWCSDTDRGDGICSLGCLTSACNWDNGDCVQHRFDRAGIQASKPHCSLLNQTTAATARGSAEVLELYPGCGDVPMRLDQNTAGGNGGAVYYDSCHQLDTSCFIKGMGPLSGSRAILLRNNSAQAGAAIFVNCSSIGAICRAVFSGNNSLGALPGVPRMDFAGGKASLYGDSVATQASGLRWYGQSPDRLKVVPSQYALPPGGNLLPATVEALAGLGTSGEFQCVSQDKSRIGTIPFDEWKLSVTEKFLNSPVTLEQLGWTTDNSWKNGNARDERALQFVVVLVDEFDTIIRGQGHALIFRVCANNSNKICSSDFALLDDRYVRTDALTGISAVASRIECPTGVEEVAIQLEHMHLVQLPPLRAVVQCAACRAGETKTYSQDVATWFCHPCCDGFYVVDPNNPAHNCNLCPEGARCPNGTFVPLPGSEWQLDASNGVYTIEGCAPGSAIVRTPARHEGCVECQAGSYCTGGGMGERSCDRNSFSKPMSTEQGDCVDAQFVAFTLEMPFAASGMTRDRHKAFRKAISTAAQVPIFAVTITSASTTSGPPDIVLGGPPGPDGGGPLSLPPPEGRPPPGQDTSDGPSGLPVLAMDLAMLVATMEGNANEIVGRLILKNINHHLMQHGLPEANKLVASATVVGSVKNHSQLILITTIFVPICVLLVLALAVYTYCVRIPPLVDKDEISLARSMRDVRQHLELTIKDGYVVSNELTWWSGSNNIVIPKHQIDSAVRLWRMEDFDVNAFDALCVLIADTDYSVGGEAVRRECDNNIEPKRQALLLRRWLLTHSLDILAKCTLPADEYLIQHRSARERKSFRKFVNSFHALNSNESTSLDDEQEKIATFNYFREKVMAVRIWRDHRFELFNALKAEVQALTDRIAAKCHDRTRAIMLEDDGKLLCNLRWNPSAATIATDQGELEVNREGEEASITRQDDVRVQAIVVHPDCSKEEVYERSRPYLMLREGMDSLVDPVILRQMHEMADETVFIAQLHRRARLMDRAFKSNVYNALAKTSLKNVEDASDTSEVCGGGGDDDDEIGYASQPVRQRVMRVPVKDSDTAERSPPVLAVSVHTCEDVEISLSESEISTASKQAARSDLTADLKKDVPSDPAQSNIPRAPGASRTTEIPPEASVKTDMIPTCERKQLDINISNMNEASFGDLERGRSGQKEQTESVATSNRNQEGEKTRSIATVVDSYSDRSRAGSLCLDIFPGGPSYVSINFTAIKTKKRMREKMMKYLHNGPRNRWPLVANICDPVRLAIVCDCPTHIIQLVKWLVESPEKTGLTVCRIKNKFLLAENEVTDGYRDVALSVVFEDDGLKIIGEIQIHDKRLHELKLSMHALYRVKRALVPNNM